MTNLILETVLQLWQSGRKTKRSSEGWISGNAVCCHHRGERHDIKGRGGLIINDAKGSFQWHCFNCGFKAGWTKGKPLSKNTRNLFLWLGLPDEELKKLIFYALKEKTESEDIKLQLDFKLRDIPLPPDSMSILDWKKYGCTDQDFLNCQSYIKNRGFSLEDYPWHWSPDIRFKERVIIPFYHEKRNVGWIARKFTPGGLKFVLNRQPGYVFNIDAQFYERKYVIIVEGQFDAIAVDGVAISTNVPNAVQCARINALGKEVIVVPDKDKPGAEMLKAALENNWGMSLPPWGEDIKDVADAIKKYGRIYTLAAILHYRETNQIKIEIMKNKLEKIKNDNKKDGLQL